MGFVNGKTYRFINKYYSSHALNVFGTNAASTGRNVCLFKDDDTDIMQDWVVKTSGSGYRMHSAVNQSFVLDCSDGSMSSSYKNNAHLCATSQTSTKDSQVEFKKVGDNVYKIYLPGKGLYLTATNTKLVNNLPASSIGNADALTGGTGGQSNVYWASNSTSIKQQWIVSPEVDGGGTTPDDNDFFWPTESHTLSQGGSYGNGHLGIDIRATNPGVAGDEVYAFADGIVAKITTPSSNDGYGVRLHHINPYPQQTNGKKQLRTQYLHFCQEPTVKKNEYVRAGQVIGYMGNTGNSTGVHLHFETRVSDTEFPMEENVYSDYNQGTVVDPMIFVGKLQ